MIYMAGAILIFEFSCIVEDTNTHFSEKLHSVQYIDCCVTRRDAARLEGVNAPGVELWGRKKHVNVPA